jgi:hypothetical protein
MALPSFISAPAPVYLALASKGRKEIKRRELKL